MNLAELIKRPPDADTLSLWLQKVPYAVHLGIRAEVHDGDILFILPADRKLVGNPTLPAIHGGVVGAFMEQAGTFYLIARMAAPVLPKIINFSLDYLRPARLRDSFAICTLTRQGRQIANVSITAWQDDRTAPVALARAHFLLPDGD
ncbi:MAG: PaaI family thioesterase [Pseudomonadales bacterium]|nr:PaaI family thioesterase [Pseudomonadales bacterium]MCP5189227.1 PaaI family thioesterase [Pseudomonadales bacterium]